MSFPLGSYVIVTPARNEEAFIELTIKAVIAQSLLPKEWVIVSDGSTDRTDAIVRGYAERFSFIHLHRVDGHERRNFAAKVAAFRSGTDVLETDTYDFIGNLDADVSFGTLYFEHLLANFIDRPRLGIAGGVIVEQLGSSHRPQSIDRYSVAGAVQTFRRTCLDEIGGYAPIPSGGVDAAAEIMARMRGWEVETIPALRVLHHRRIATGGGTVLRTRFRQGVNHRLLGYHPLFQLMSSLYHTKEKPYLIGALLTFIGYLWSGLQHGDYVLPRNVVAFLRTEQRNRIRHLLNELVRRV